VCGPFSEKCSTLSFSPHDPPPPAVPPPLHSLALLADAAQADIDSMNEHKDRLLARAVELGVGSEDELAGYRGMGSAPAAAPEATSFLEALASGAGAGADAGVAVSGLSFLASAESVPEASGLPFAVGGFDALTVGRGDGE
jgi:hypothetical protein